MPDITVTSSGATWAARSVNDQVWRIVEGDVTCNHCGEHIFPAGGEGRTSDFGFGVFAFGGKPPTNIVCPVCRGLLYPTKPDDLLPG